MADEAGQIAGAAVQALGNYAVQVASNKRQFKYQKEAMALQQGYNKELWDYQNAYNTPQAQMERLSAAGLNPHLIYGSGSAGAGNAGPIAPTEVPARQAARGEIPDLMMRRLQVRQMDAQYAATVQAIEQSKTRSALIEIEQALKNLQVMKSGAESKYFERNALAESRTRSFVAERAQSLMFNETRKGELMDQMQDMRKRQIRSMELDNAFKANRNELAKWGLYSSDDPRFRLLIQAAHRMGVDIDDLIKRGYNEMKYLFSGFKD